MSYEADLRIFNELRKHPWIPEHKHFIDGELAKLLVNPDTRKDGERLKKDYDDKMARYVAEQEALNPTPKKPEAPKEVPVDTPKVEESKKAKKKKLFPSI